MSALTMLPLLQPVVLYLPVHVSKKLRYTLKISKAINETALQIILERKHYCAYMRVTDVIPHGWPDSVTWNVGGGGHVANI